MRPYSHSKPNRAQDMRKLFLTVNIIISIAIIYFWTIPNYFNYTKTKIYILKNWTL